MFQKLTRTLLFLWCVIVVPSWVSVAHAEVVTTEINGTITFASYDVGINEMPIPGIRVGDAFTGSFTFDSSVMPPQTSPFLPGLYSQTFGPGEGAISATIHIGDLTFSTDFTEQTSVSIRDNDTDSAGQSARHSIFLFVACDAGGLVSAAAES